MAFPIIPIVDVAFKLLNKIIPDKAEREKHEREVIRMHAEGEFKAVEQQLSVIMAEAQSSDPWTSRARPSFLYVFYIIILSAIPMGVVSAVSPETAIHIADGFNDWLGAIPDKMWDLFLFGFLGYVGGRSWEKNGVVGAKK